MGPPRLKDMTSPGRITIGLLLFGLFGGCATVSTTEGGDCVSHYDPVATASTWADLEQVMVSDSRWGHVAAVRTQARGEYVGAGDQAVLRVVDLLDRRDRRLAQADVWRTESGGWSAGVWQQCID